MVWMNEKRNKTTDKIFHLRDGSEHLNREIKKHNKKRTTEMQP